MIIKESCEERYSIAPPATTELKLGMIQTKCGFV